MNLWDLLLFYWNNYFYLVLVKRCCKLLTFRVPNTVETLFCLFFKSNGPILIRKADKGKTIDYNYYTENCLKPVINEIWKQEKSWRTKCIKLLHDNGRSHVHQDVIDNLTQEGIEIIPHPPYSPDLVPCEFWLNDYIVFFRVYKKFAVDFLHKRMIFLKLCNQLWSKDPISTRE